MQRVVDDLIDPAAHLALDEALLLDADEGISSEVLRVWEFRAPVVVAGRSTRVEDEIDLAYCSARGIPVLRRCSGGASVLGGPGCLIYSVVLSHERHAALKQIDVAHQFVISRVLRALQRQVPESEQQGTSDLTWRNRKCSGNSLRIARQHLLYHGTILYDFDLSLIAKCLKVAPRQPEYRAGRDHASFLTNVPIDVHTFCADLCQVFDVRGQVDSELWRGRIRELREQRYDQMSWHLRR